MAKATPQVRRYMTTTPEVIDPALPVAEAQRLLAAKGIRHLPVVKDDRLVGLISQGDMRLFETLDGIDPESVPVEDIMQRHIFSVRPEAELDEVVREMAAHKHGSAVVIDNGHVVGIFTTIDALNALGELLQGQRAH